MVCLELEPRAAGWKEETNPLSYAWFCVNDLKHVAMIITVANLII